MGIPLIQPHGAYDEMIPFLLALRTAGLETHFGRRLYGDWLVGFSEIPRSEALELTEAGVRSSFRAITLVGVLPLARAFSCDSSDGCHALPEFLGVFAMFADSLKVGVAAYQNDPFAWG